MATAGELLTLPELAASRGVTPDRLRRAVRPRLPELLAAGLAVRGGPLTLVPADRVEDLLTRLDDPPPDERLCRRG